AGIALSEAKRTLVVARLAKILRARGFATFNAYLDHLERAGTPLESQEFVNALTTNLTRFWREDHHFEHLTQYVGQIIRARAGTGADRRLRIWSAGCSTGQEAYTIALSLLAAWPELKRWDLRILATDIDTNVLDRAATGLYPESELNGLSPERVRLFEKAGAGRIRVPEEIASLVVFKPLNLLGPWPIRGKFEAIFCRNVTIYFDKPTQAELFGRLAEVMAPAGVLYIGHSENLGVHNHRFRSGGKTIYQLRDGPRARSAA
ncbi:MAG: CheR family methyltransferase, partial [Devosia sp.]